jgi:hypothetical protein
VVGAKLGQLRLSTGEAALAHRCRRRARGTTNTTVRFRWRCDFSDRATSVRRTLSNPQSFKSNTPHAPPEVTRVGLTAEQHVPPSGGCDDEPPHAHCGSRHNYLTRQVAALDATEKGHTGLASYYTERGETPGVWIGSGMDGIDGLTTGDPVTAEQMRALFGCGLHPLAELRQQQLEGPDLTPRDYQDAARLDRDAVQDR